jgi:hypothetical protein
MSPTFNVSVVTETDISLLFVGEVDRHCNVTLLPDEGIVVFKGKLYQKHFL